VLGAPWEGAPHRALGRALLAHGRAREATFELAVAAGIGRGHDDLAWLARGYEAMGLIDEALGAYQRALAGGLPADLYAATRDRYLALARREGAALDRPRSGP
jgi:tetratricopeptide (TPR) repeat protein